jgi:hypothetical protein
MISHKQGHKGHKEEFSVAHLRGLCGLAVKLSTQITNEAHPILYHIPHR